MHTNIPLKSLPQIQGMTHIQSVELTFLRDDAERSPEAYCAAMLWGEEKIPQLFYSNFRSDFDPLLDNPHLRSRLVGIYTAPPSLEGRVELLKTLFTDIAFCLGLEVAK